jgi:superfamily II DNA/RNA helicase
MITDTTFFTNEPGYSLLDRFKKTLEHVQHFDVLVGYFRTSGFYQLYESFESIDKIRILVGLNIDQKTYEIIEETRSRGEFDFESHSRTKRMFSEQTASEMDESEDSYETEIGIRKFLEFLTADCINKEQDIANGGNGKKMELRAYPSENIHAKVYVSRFKEDELDFGRVITGSSNFSESGLIANREFNVELKDRIDVEFALKQFENLWKDGVNISQEYVETIQNKTWLNDTIIPYHLYLKMLYEYLKEDINLDEEIELDLPEGFMELEYQKQAVVSAKKILDAYNGVFLADVVGLGKTFISAMLAQQLPGGKMVICPPVLKDYWEETFFDFGIKKTKVESLGKLDQIIKDGTEKYDYIFIDEAHRFRNEYTQGFEMVHQICHGKKVILISATPLNNTFDDILSQLKLFQIPKKSTIPGVPNLEKFFKSLTRRLKKIKKSDVEYISAIKEGSGKIRENILKYIMVRRTRSEITEYFNKDIDEQGLFFPDVEDPRRIIYEFDDEINTTFNNTIELLKKFKYARYTPLLYLKEEVSELEKQSQRNVGGFMKVILVKRLESSFHAFRKTIYRFVESYVNFIDMFNRGTIYISKTVDVYDLLDEDNEDKIHQFIEQERISRYDAEQFRPEFIEDLKADLKLLKVIRDLWSVVDSDPKLKTFIDDLKTNNELKDKKIIIFTESKETGDYLYNNLSARFPNKVLFYSSEGGQTAEGKKPVIDARRIIKENYDPTHRTRNDDVRILISTDILAEGINLHRSNIVVNYDLPWNPTKVLQRVGRVNRLGTEHTSIYVFNFFPTDQSDRHIGLEDNIKSKIQAFHDTLGEDAKYLTDEEIVSSHELFGDTLYQRLADKKTYAGDDGEGQSELKYLKFIRDIRDNQPSLFEKIKNLPKKARSSRQCDMKDDQLITFFRKGKLKKFFMSGGAGSRECTFFEAADILECDKGTKREKIPKQFYPMLKDNKEQFRFVTSGEDFEPKGSGGRGGLSNERYVVTRLKTKDFRKYQGFTDDDEEYIRLVLRGYEDGVIPKNTTKGIKKKIEKESNPLKVLAILKKSIPNNILDAGRPGQQIPSAKREVILSEFLTGTFENVFSKNE